MLGTYQIWLRHVFGHQLEPNPSNSGDGKPCEKRIASADTERGEHLVAKQGESEAEHGPEDGRGGQSTRRVREGVYKVELDGQAKEG